MTSVIAAAVLLSGSVMTAGAAGNANNSESCKRVYVVNSYGSGKSQTLRDFLKSYGFDLDSILKQYSPKQDATCSGGNCAPTEQPTQPATQAPTQPATQPVTQAPTQPATQPSIAPSVPVVQTDSAYQKAYENEVVRLVNVERAKYGLATLKVNDLAVKGAEIRAKEITGLFSHTRPNGTSCFTVCKELGISYRSAGENIAYGQRTPQQVVNGWMNSEGHRKNILSASFTSIGVGCYRQGNTLYWSQLFIG